MGEQVEKEQLPFEEAGTDGTADVSVTDGALALTPAVDATVEAVRTTANAQAWGLTIPSDFTPATKAQVTYWRELCGAISLAGKDGMRDDDWPADLAPANPTLQAMAERGLIVRRRRAWHLKRKWYAWLQYLRQTAVPTPELAIAERAQPVSCQRGRWRDLATHPACLTRASAR